MSSSNPFALNSLADALPSDESVGKVQTSVWQNPCSASGSQSGNNSNSQTTSGSQSGSQSGSNSNSQTIRGSQSGSQGGSQSSTTQSSQPFGFDFAFSLPPPMDRSLPFIQMPPFDYFKGDTMLENKLNLYNIHIAALKKCLNSFKRKLGKSIREIDSFQPNLFDSSASLPLQSFTQNGYNAKLDSLEKDKNSLGKLIIKLNRTLDRLNCQTKDYLTKAKSCQEYSTQLEIHLRSKNQVKAHNLYLKFLAMQARKKAEKVKEDTAMEAVANRMKSMNLGKRDGSSLVDQRIEKKKKISKQMKEKEEVVKEREQYRDKDEESDGEDLSTTEVADEMNREGRRRDDPNLEELVESGDEEEK